MTFEIREYKAGDEKYIAGLESECFAEPWSESGIAEAARFGTDFFVALSGGRIIGYGGMKVLPPEAFISNIAVTEEARRQGVGRAVTRRLMEHAKNAGAVSVSLEVRESNLPARNMYESLGFRRAGMRKNFYKRPAEDAIIMTFETEKR